MSCLLLGGHGATKRFRSRHSGLGSWGDIPTIMPPFL